jgi:hypothetical protein
MSALEFGQWITYFEREQLHPAADRQRHAQLMAATASGPMTRRDAAPWSTTHFLPPDPWAPAEPDEPPPPPTAAQLAAQIAALNARVG